MTSELTASFSWNPSTIDINRFQIDLLKSSFDKAKESLNFDTAPVSNVLQWEKRLQVG